MKTPTPISFSINAIVGENVTKRFRIVSIPKHASFKKPIVQMDFLKNQTLTAIRRSTPRRQIFVARGETVVSSQKTASKNRRAIASSPESTNRIREWLRPQTRSCRSEAWKSAYLQMLRDARTFALVASFSDFDWHRSSNGSAGLFAFPKLQALIGFPIRTYSSGMYVRLVFWIAISADPDVILLHEMVSIGDKEFSEKRRVRMHALRADDPSVVRQSRVNSPRRHPHARSGGPRPRRLSQ